LYLPTFFHPVAGTYDLVVHFHDISSVQERNFEQAGVNSVIVSINKGVASDAYAAAFSAPGSSDALLATTQRVLERTQRVSSFRLGRIALSAWSAGFASVGAILRQPGNADRIDGILLADGPHVNYLSKGEINDRARSFPSRARRGPSTSFSGACSDAIPIANRTYPSPDGSPQGNRAPAAETATARLRAGPAWPE
jgi:hypothetical protein